MAVLLERRQDRVRDARRGPVAGDEGVLPAAAGARRRGPARPCRPRGVAGRGGRADGDLRRGPQRLAPPAARLARRARPRGVRRRALALRVERPLPRRALGGAVPAPGLALRESGCVSELPDRGTGGVLLRGESLGRRSRRLPLVAARRTAAGRGGSGLTRLRRASAD